MRDRKSLSFDSDFRRFNIFRGMNQRKSDNRQQQLLDIHHAREQHFQRVEREFQQRQHEQQWQDE